MKIKPIREKNELVRIIKALAKDLDARAESIADDYNTKVRKIDIQASIEIDCINEWEITKYYPVIADEVVVKTNESIIKNPCDIKIGIDYGNGLSKSSMFGGGG